MLKTYILDTNILLQSPEAIFGFDDNNVVITGTTLQELDRKKEDRNLQYNARKTAKIIDNLRETGNLLEGVPLPNGGKFFIAICPPTSNINEYVFSLKKGDNQIINTVLGLMKSGFPNCILVSNDTYMRINCSAMKIPVEPYHNDEAVEHEYLGKEMIYTDASVVDKLYADKRIASLKEFIENEYIIIKDFSENKSALAQYKNGELFLIKKQKAYGVSPINSSQIFALHALLAPVEEIPLVILKGPAGCAKTFLSLAAGLDQTLDDPRKYNKIMITRNNITNDEGFGYLPGELEEKMAPLIAPFYDNLESLIRKDDDIDNLEVQTQMDYLFDTGTIEIAPMAYMRGRSICNRFLILDEAQNTTASQIRDVVTRAGKGTKIIVCGDPSQIDSPYLNEKNCGINVLSSSMIGSPLVAQLTFSPNDSVRSVLAKEAISRLY